MAVVYCKICGKRGRVIGRGTSPISGYCAYHKALLLAKKTKQQVKDATEAVMNEADRIAHGKK